MISDKEQETFVLAGILAFTDKVIDDTAKQHIKEVLGMTQVGQMLMEEGRIKGKLEGRIEGKLEGRQEESKKNALNMLKRNYSPEEIAIILELPAETIRAWQKEVQE